MLKRLLTIDHWRILVRMTSTNRWHHYQALLPNIFLNRSKHVSPPTYITSTTDWTIFSRPLTLRYLRNLIFNNFRILHSHRSDNINELLIMEALYIKFKNPELNSGLKASKELSLFTYRPYSLLHFRLVLLPPHGEYFSTGKINSLLCAKFKFTCCNFHKPAVL